MKIRMYYESKLDKDSIVLEVPDQAAANAKLRKLPAEKQMKISAKFYHGEMPWRYDDEMC